MDFVPRRSLPHEVPSWVGSGSFFFLTLCAESRVGNSLANDKTAEKIFACAKFYHLKRNWYVILLLVMPDHIHMLVAFPAQERMRKIFGRWKSFVSKFALIIWQADFFDHRLRSHESLDLKVAYIRENPVRASLVKDANAWPWVWDDFEQELCGLNGKPTPKEVEPGGSTPPQPN